MNKPRIGSACTGYGGLDLAVMDVFGGSMAWHCQYEPPDKHGREDRHQYAARVLEHHWPGVPNHGDITKVDWAQVEPVDIFTAGFPCTDVSAAGLRAGIAAGTRSGLWFHVAQGIQMLRPPLVVIENVEGLLSARADRGVGPTDPDVEAAGEHALRALGCVLGDLADLGFNAEWCRVAASDVGAAHRRNRIFVIAWPADTEGSGLQGAWLRGWPSLDGGDAVSHPDGVGHQWDGAAGQPAQRHAAGAGRADADPARVRAGEPADQAVAVAEGGASRAVPGGGDERVVSDAQGVGRREGGAEPAGIVGGPDASIGRAAPPADAMRDGRERGAERDLGQEARIEAPHGDDPVRRVLDWGPYGPAVARWGAVLGRPAPWPTELGRDDRFRLSPRFVEWLMGLPAGWVTDVPATPGMRPAGLRNARLKALGNGVVPQQAAYALRLLLARIGREVAA